MQPNKKVEGGISNNVCCHLKKFQFISTCCISHKCGHCGSKGRANFALTTFTDFGETMTRAKQCVLGQAALASYNFPYKCAFYKNHLRPCG